MYVCPRHRIAFVAIPKTGTRSIYDALQRHFHGERMKDHQVVLPEIYRNYYTFAVIRNPYARTVSMWWSTCKRNNDKRHFIEKYLKSENTFLNFCRHIDIINEIENRYVTKPQSVWLTHNRYDKLIHFETLAKEWLQMPFNGARIPLGHINPTTMVTKGNPVIRKSYKTYLCKESIEIVNQYFKLDFELTGYPMI